MRRGVYGTVNNNTVPTDVRSLELSNIAWIRDNAYKIDCIHAASENINCVVSEIDNIVHIRNELQPVSYYDDLKSCTQIQSNNLSCMNQVYNDFSTNYSDFIGHSDDYIDHKFSQCMQIYDTYNTDHHLAEIDCLSGNMANIVYLASSINGLDQNVQCISESKDYVKCVADNFNIICSLRFLNITCSQLDDITNLSEIKSEISSLYQYKDYIACASNNLSDILNASCYIDQFANYCEQLSDVQAYSQCLLALDPGLSYTEALGSNISSVKCVADNMSIINNSSDTLTCLGDDLKTINNRLIAINTKINGFASIFQNQCDIYENICSEIYPDIQSNAQCSSNMLLCTISYSNNACCWAQCACKWNCNYVDDYNVSTNTTWSSSCINSCMEKVLCGCGEVCYQETVDSMVDWFNCHCNNIVGGTMIIVNSDSSVDCMSTQYVTCYNDSNELELVRSAINYKAVGMINGQETTGSICIYDPNDVNDQSVTDAQWEGI